MSRIALSVGVLMVAALQAWDSNALLAEPFVQAIVLVAVVVPAATIFATHDVRMRGAAVLVAAILLVAARVVSAQPMSGLALSAFVPAVAVFLDHARTLKTKKPGASSSVR